MPQDIVTMNWRIRIVDGATGEQSEISPVFPRHADAAQGRISILAAVGKALLGLAVVVIEYQAEAAPPLRARRRAGP